jgi:hypothetical protein
LAVIQRSEATKDLLLAQTQNEVSPFRRELQNAAQAPSQARTQDDNQTKKTN